MVGLGAAAKFAPLTLAPLFLRGRDALLSRRTIAAAVLMVAVVAAAFLPFIPPHGLHQLYDRTLGSQVNRSSPFSVWGQTSLDWLQVVWQVLSVGLAVLVALVPRRRTVVQIAALAAAVLIAFQIGADHWFYLYVVWFAPLIFVALFTAYDRSTKDDDLDEWEQPATRELRPSLRAPAAAR